MLDGQRAGQADRVIAGRHTAEPDGLGIDRRGDVLVLALDGVGSVSAG